MTQRITRRRFTTVVTGVMAGASLAGTDMGGRAFGAEPDALQEIKKRGFMRVGTFSIPPESWIDIGTGEWRGIDADFSKAIGKALGVAVDPVVLIHAALGPALDANRVDVIAGLYKTPEREKVMAYNEVPFWYGIDVLIARTNGDVTRVEDLKGRTLGTVRGSAQEIEATDLQKRFGVASIRKYDSADPMLLDLKAGRLDAAIWWGFTFDYATKQNPHYDLKVVEYLPPEYLGSTTLPATYYVFAKQGTSSLIEAFDAEIRQLKASGVDKEIMKRYGLTNPAYVTGKFQ